jgi:hypothetical protein
VSLQPKSGEEKGGQASDEAMLASASVSLSNADRAIERAKIDRNELTKRIVAAEDGRRHAFRSPFIADHPLRSIELF